MLAARFAGGLGILLLTHTNVITNPGMKERRDVSGPPKRKR
jgi:hypothetical protein